MHWDCVAGGCKIINSCFTRWWGCGFLCCRYWWYQVRVCLSFFRARLRSIACVMVLGSKTPRQAPTEAKVPSRNLRHTLTWLSAFLNREIRNYLRFRMKQKLYFFVILFPIPMSFGNRTEFCASGGSGHSVGDNFLIFLICNNKANTWHHDSISTYILLL